ncbi:hypothetical protein JMJ77_0013151, partial [Colletotrichum scovillei]
STPNSSSFLPFIHNKTGAPSIGRYCRKATRNPPEQSDRQVPIASPRFMARTKEKRKQGGEREDDWTSRLTVPADRMSQNV